MKYLFKFLLLCTIVVFTACGSDDSDSAPSNEVKCYVTYTLSSDNGEPMTRAILSKVISNSEVFDEFYSKMVSGELVAPSYDLTFVEKTSGVTYHFTGTWAGHDVLTLRAGTYKITGTAKAEGKNLQDKCSLTFDDEMEISVNSSTITLNAKYDCALVVFSDESIKELKNYSGSNTQSFFTFSKYKYAFINSTLYDTDKKNDAYISGTHTNGTAFKISTGNLNFEKGKYYVYSDVATQFNIEEMEEGDSESELSVQTLIIDGTSQPPLVGGYINNYNESLIDKGGIIVCINANDAKVTDDTKFYEKYGCDNWVDPQNTTYIAFDLSNVSKEECSIRLRHLMGNKDYYVRAYVVCKDKTVLYGDIEKIHTQNFNRYPGRADFANVYHAFDYTLFDLETDIIMDITNEGYYSSTQANPTSCTYYSKGSNNSMYKFKTKFSYKHWYYYAGHKDGVPPLSDMKDPIISFDGSKITMIPQDGANQIFYSIDGDGLNPESFTETYTGPISINKSCVIHCYAQKGDIPTNVTSYQIIK